MLAQALVPKAPSASTSMPTTITAAATRPRAPPGKLLIFSPLGRLENLQMKNPRTSCAARKQIPASTIVSDICSSISGPWVEMSTGGSQMCSTMGIAEAIAITMIVTAKNFAIRVSLAQRRLSSAELRAADGIAHRRPAPRNGPISPYR